MYLALATKREKLPKNYGSARLFKIVRSHFPRSNPRRAIQTIGDAKAVVWSEKQNLMPIVDIHVVRGLFTAEQKLALISNVTDAVVAIEGEHIRELTRVKINEFASPDLTAALKLPHALAPKVQSGQRPPPNHLVGDKI
jgi:4-oxalocrotonate tautomerase